MLNSFYVDGWDDAQCGFYPMKRKEFKSKEDYKQYRKGYKAGMKKRNKK